MRYLTNSETSASEVTVARASGLSSDASRVDRAMHATYALPYNITAETHVDFGIPGWGPFGILPYLPRISMVVKLEGGEIEYFNYPFAGSYHYIKVKSKKGLSRTEKAYKHRDGKGESRWTT